MYILLRSTCVFMPNWWREETKSWKVLQNLPEWDHLGAVNNQARTAHIHKSTKHHSNCNALKVYYTNMNNSLLSKCDELSIISKDDDVIARNGEIPYPELLQIPGYNLFTNDLQEPGTRGACIYIRDNHKVCRYPHPAHDQFSDTVWITFKTKDTSTLIGCIYRSGTPETPRQRDKQLHAALRHSSEVTEWHMPL